MSHHIRFWFLSHTENSKNFSRRFYFHGSSQMPSFMKIKPSGNGKITLSFTDVGKSCASCKFLTWKICLLTLFVKIKLSQKFLNLNYVHREGSDEHAHMNPHLHMKYGSKGRSRSNARHLAPLDSWARISKVRHEYLKYIFTISTSAIILSAGPYIYIYIHAPKYDLSGALSVNYVKKIYNISSNQQIEIIYNIILPPDEQNFRA